MPPNDGKKLKIIKVKGDHINQYVSPNFPNMPRLYIELLENKEKVKVELRKKDFVSKNIGAIIFLIFLL